jgi:hypothetical protein
MSRVRILAVGVALLAPLWVGAQVSEESYRNLVAARAHARCSALAGSFDQVLEREHLIAGYKAMKQSDYAVGMAQRLDAAEAEGIGFSYGR